MFMDQAGRRGMAKRVLVARASRHVAIQRSVQGRIPGVPIFLIGVLRDTPGRSWYTHPTPGCGARRLRAHGLGIRHGLRGCWPIFDRSKTHPLHTHIHYPRKIPDNTAFTPAVRSTVIVTVPPAATLIGNDIPAPSWKELVKPLGVST